MTGDPWAWTETFSRTDRTRPVRRRLESEARHSAECDGPGCAYKACMCWCHAAATPDTATEG